MKKKQLLSLALAGVMACSVIGMSGCGKEEASGGTDFSWWITQTDGAGQYYENYDDNPGIQWLNQQYWDTENKTIGTADNGTNIRFTFQAPVAGSEQDNFNTMMGTGEYTDIVDISMSTDNARSWYEEGVALDLTEWVEEYCPNYVEYLDANPDIKAMVTDTDEDGNVHYYQMSCIQDGVNTPWSGYVYRRDWVVQYAEPTEYVWDWDSEYVKEHGHPAITPLSEAQAQNNLEGWKVNEVTEFTSSDGEDPNNTYTDNVIFPSGRDYPYTISDWEWMFEAFEKAIADRGWSDDSNAYATTIYYMGYDPLGELNSSFGVGTGDWNKDTENNAEFTGDTEEFQSYLECVQHWYNEGWLDKAFETRASDYFYTINQAGQMQGKTGLFFSYTGTLGTGIRATCLDERDQQSAYVMGCPLPVNDVYGGDSSKFVTPDAVFQSSRVDSSIIVTNKAEDKDLAALFTFFNWLYSRDGAVTRTIGLSSEQLADANITEHNTYETVGIDGAYTTEERDGKTVYSLTYQDGVGDFGGALSFGRLAVGLRLVPSSPDNDYIIDGHKASVNQEAESFWAMYENTASLMNYSSRYTSEETDENGTINTELMDYTAQHLPALIKSGDLSGWDEYVSGLGDIDIETHVNNDQAMLDRLYK